MRFLTFSISNHCRRFRGSTKCCRHCLKRVVELWSKIHACNVYQTDLPSITACGLRRLLSLTLGGLGVANPKSFLDNEPLEQLLKTELDLPLIGKAIESGQLRAIGITASSYRRSSVIMFIDRKILEWQRARREGLRSRIT